MICFRYIFVNTLHKGDNIDDDDDDDGGDDNSNNNNNNNNIDTTNVEPEMYGIIDNNWYHRNSNNRFK